MVTAAASCCWVYWPCARVKVCWVPSIDTDSWSFEPVVMVVVVGRALAPSTVAPADAWVTAMVWAPSASPLPASEAIPRPEPPDATSKSPLATTSLAEATVPEETRVSAVASWLTLKVVEPGTAPVLVVAVATEEFEEVAETSLANASGALIVSAALWSAERSLCTVW